MHATNDEPGHTLTPSDLVFLHGEQFASKVLVGNTALLHTDAKVSTAQLGQALLAAAFLGCERAGSLQLDVRQKKALFGLRKVDSLYALADEGIEAWPQGSLEADLAGLAASLGSGTEPAEARALVYAWLQQDSASPWQAVVEKVRAGMAARGLLVAEEKTRLKIFSVTHYELPESTARLRTQVSAESARQLLSNCQQYRPEIWKLLRHHLNGAIRDRTEQSDLDPD